MEQNFFKYLPSEIITNILSRPSVRTIAISKCVCKSWLNLLDSDEFVKSHLSRSGGAAAGLAVSMREGNSSRCTVFELDDEIDLESSRDRQLNRLTKFNFPQRVQIEGSANGILFLRRKEFCFDVLYVCNPISREYIEIHCPVKIFVPRKVIYGFGASKITGQHKLVCIRRNLARDCHVYTLGTGSWRRVEPAGVLRDFSIAYAFLNGNLHWLVSDSNDVLWISVFDLETERFSAIAVPPPYVDVDCRGFSAVRGCLCLYNCTSEDETGMIVIWLMKEYEDEKSWTKEYVVNLKFDFHGYEYRHVPIYLVKVFEDGGILMVCDERLLCYYSNKTKTAQVIGVLDGRQVCIDSMLLTPSFLSLKSCFPMENVISL